MKILMFTPYFHPDTGGCVSRVDALAKYFKREGHDPVVVVPYVKKFNYSKLGYKVIRKKMFSSKFDIFKFFKTVLEIRRLFDEEKPDFVYVTTPPDYFAFAAIFALKGKKILLDVRDPWVEGLKSESANRIKLKIAEKMEGFICNKATVITCVTPLIKKILKNRYNFEDNKIIVLPNGIDFDLIKGVKKVTKKKEWNNKKILLYMGVFGSAQDLHGFLRKFSTLLDNYHFHVILIGDGKDKDKLLAMKEERRNIEIIPRMSKEKVLKWVKMCDYGLVVLANKEELKYAIPSKIFDFMAFGKPVLVYGPKNSQLQKLVEEEGIGVFVESKKDFEDKIKLLMKNYFIYSKNARKVIKEKYNREVTAKKMLKIMKRLC